MAKIRDGTTLRSVEYDRVLQWLLAKDECQSKEDDVH